MKYKVKIASILLILLAIVALVIPPVETISDFSTSSIYCYSYSTGSYTNLEVHAYLTQGYGSAAAELRIHRYTPGIRLYKEVWKNGESKPSVVVDIIAFDA